MQELDVYDLGEISAERPRPAPAPTVRRARRRALPRRSRSAIPAAAGSLSLLVPGSGQILLGEWRLGLLYVSGVAFLASLVWAIYGTLDRLVETLVLLGVPPSAGAVTVAVAILAGGALHSSGAVEAHRRGCAAAEASLPHPLLAGLASLVVPGWGQLLDGRRGRAALFLGIVWALATAWIAVSPPGQRILATAAIALPATFRDGWGPIALVAASAVTWVLGVYDAVAGAIAGRRA